MAARRGGAEAGRLLVIMSAPAAPVVTGISTDTGNDSSDGLTSDATLVISGTAEPNSAGDGVS